MRAVKGKNTAPEIIVRKIIHRLGYRYRLHDSSLPGKPDIVFQKKKKVIFVHGCFWHGHDCKRGNRIPTTNQPYWIKKIERNRKKNLVDREELQSNGWSVLIIWECDLKDLVKIENILSAFLENANTK